MNTPQDFHTMLQSQLEHQETKTRLTQAEKLLRTCDTVIKGMARTLATRSEALNLETRRALDAERKLANIPLWIRRIFDAD